MKRWKQLVLLLIGITAVALVVYFNDPALIASTILRANPRLLALASLLEAISMLFFSIAWHLILRTISVRIPVGESVKASLISIFGDIVIPSASVSGEFMRVTYVRNKLLVPVGKALVSVTLHRFLYSLSFILFIIAGSLLLGREIGLVELSYITASFVILSLLLLMYFKPRAVLGKINMVLERLPIKQRSKDKVRDVLGSVVEGLLEAGRSKPMLGLSFIALLTQWMFGSLAQLMVFYSLGYEEITLPMILVVYPIYAALTITAIGVPGSIGLVETGMTLAYTYLGVPPHIAATAVITSRAVVLATDLSITFLVFIKESKHIG